MSDFDTEIAAAQAEVDAAENTIDHARDDFLSTAAEVVARWWETAARDATKKYPERAVELGKDGIGDLKSKLAELQARAPEIVVKHLGPESAVWRLKDEGQSSSDKSYVYNPYEVRDDNVPSVFADELRKVLGEVGSLLVEAGLGTREEWPGRGYPYGLWFRRDLEPLAASSARYAAAYKTAVVARRHLASVEKAKAEARAESLWDEA